MKVTIDIEENAATEALQSFDYMAETLRGKTKTIVVVGCNPILVLVEQLQAASRRADAKKQS